MTNHVYRIMQQFRLAARREVTHVGVGVLGTLKVEPASIYNLVLLVDAEALDVFTAAGYDAPKDAISSERPA